MFLQDECLQGKFDFGIMQKKFCILIVFPRTNCAAHILMNTYKKRLRLFAERHGAKISYLHDGGLTFHTEKGTIDFEPNSNEEMTCTVITSSGETSFTSRKELIFAIADMFVSKGKLDVLSPTGTPLTLNDYIVEERQEQAVEKLRKKIGDGNAENGMLGGNHYNAEYFNGILILFDIFSGAPTNVIEIG